MQIGTFTVTFDTSFSLIPLLESTLLFPPSSTLFFHLSTPPHPPQFCYAILYCFSPTCSKRCLSTRLTNTAFVTHCPELCPPTSIFRTVIVKKKMANNAYPDYDVRSRDDANNREWLARNPEQRYDLPRPFRPRPIPEGQVERRFMGPVDSPATIATRHGAVLQAVENYKTRCPDTARRMADAGAAFTRHWEEARAAERELAGASGGEVAGGAQP